MENMQQGQRRLAKKEVEKKEMFIWAPEFPNLKQVMGVFMKTPSGPITEL